MPSTLPVYAGVDRSAIDAMVVGTDVRPLLEAAGIVIPADYTERIDLADPADPPCDWIVQLYGNLVTDSIVCRAGTDHPAAIVDLVQDCDTEGDVADCRLVLARADALDVRSLTSVLSLPVDLEARFGETPTRTEGDTAFFDTRTPGHDLEEVRAALGAPCPMHFQFSASVPEPFRYRDGPASGDDDFGYLLCGLPDDRLATVRVTTYGDGWFVAPPRTFALPGPIEEPAASDSTSSVPTATSSVVPSTSPPSSPPSTLDGDGGLATACSSTVGSFDPEVISTCVVTAWELGDRQLAAAWASPEVIDTLFSMGSGSGWRLDSCDQEASTGWLGYQCFLSTNGEALKLTFLAYDDGAVAGHLEIAG